MATPDVRVRFSADGTKEVVRAIDRVQKQANDAARRISNVSRTLGLFGGGAALTSMISGSIEAASAIQNFATKAGLGAAAASELAFAANKVDVSTESLAAAFKGMQTTITQATEGSKSSAAALSAVGVSIEQLRSLAPDRQFELLADAINRIEDPAARVTRAIDIFGKSGADLQLLFQRGASGIRELRNEALALGKSLSDKDLARFGEADEALKRMRASASAAGSSLTVVLAPAIIEVANAIRTLTGGATEVERLEEKLKKLREFAGEGGMVNLGFDSKLGTVALRGEIEKRIRELEIERSAIITGANKGATGIRGGRGMGDGRSTGGLVTESASSAEVVAPVARSKSRDRSAETDRLFEDQRSAASAARDIAIQTGRDLLELAGREKDAKLAALDEEITRRKLVLAVAGQLGDHEKAQLDRFRELSAARIDFEDLKQQGEAALEALDRERTRIEQEVELGITSQMSGQAELVRIEKDRVVVLRQLADALAKAAAATGDPALIAQASQFAQALDAIEVSVKRATDEFEKFKIGAAEALHGGLADFFDTMVSGSDSVKGAFKSLADSVVSAMRRMAAEALATQIFKLLSGVGGLGFLGKVLKAADGGLIRGPGSDRSDNIPALLSPGEYVVRAAAVRALGVDVLDELNRGRRLRSYGVPRFADGGLVTPMRSSTNASGDGISIVNNVDARGSSLTRSEFDAALNRSSEVTIAKVRELVHQGRI